MKLLLMLLALVVTSWGAATPTPYAVADKPGSGSLTIKPQAVPTSTTAVANVDAYVESVWVANTTGAAVTFLLADLQASPIALVPTISIPANTAQLIVIPRMLWCPNGFTVIAGAAGLTYSVTWRQ